MKKATLLKRRSKSRQTGDFPILDKTEVEYMDVAPNQIVGLSASLIPFLEHDDANRALMGSNMQRQAVPLIRPEEPYCWYRSWRQKLHAMHVSRSTLKEKVWLSLLMLMKFMFAIDRDEAEKLVSFEDDLKVYRLTKFIKTNQETCINLKPAVKKGQKVKKGDFLTEGYAYRMVNWHWVIT